MRCGNSKGFSLIELLIVVAIIGIIAAIAVPNLIASRRAANESATIAAVRSISTAEATYRETTGGGVNYVDMAGLSSQNLIDASLANATTSATARNGYIFGITLAADSKSYTIGAATVDTLYGRRRFSSDTPGVIYVDLTDVTTVPTAVTGTPLGN